MTLSSVLIQVRAPFTFSPWIRRQRTLDADSRAQAGPSQTGRLQINGKKEHCDLFTRAYNYPSYRWCPRIHIWGGFGGQTFLTRALVQRGSCHTSVNRLEPQ